MSNIRLEVWNSGHYALVFRDIEGGTHTLKPLQANDYGFKLLNIPNTQVRQRSRSIRIYSTPKTPYQAYSMFRSHRRPNPAFCLGPKRTVLGTNFIDDMASVRVSTSISTAATCESPVSLSSVITVSLAVSAMPISSLAFVSLSVFPGDLIFELRGLLRYFSPFGLRSRLRR